MDWLAVAFEKTWFYVAALVVGAVYGLGGIVHVANILGFGERKWSDAPLSWKIGDIVWGALDVIAVVGIIMRAPLGLVALAAAAVSQIFVYGLFPGAFAMNDKHRSALRGMVAFHAVVLVILAVLVYFAGDRSEASMH